MENEAKDSRTFTDRQLDWVKVLGRAHAEELFRCLFEVVKRDVESAKKHARGIEPSCGDLDRGIFDVGTVELSKLGAPAIARQRYFRLLDKDVRIVVYDEDQNEILHAAPALYPPQHYLLDVEERERPMRLWQFSRLALEPLFFPPTGRPRTVSV